MAKTFKFGENGKWATKTGSSLAYNDQNDNFKPIPFSVTRDGIATRVNKEGLIEVVGTINYVLTIRTVQRVLHF